jgi:hypothetical protein
MPSRHRHGDLDALATVSIAAAALAPVGRKIRRIHRLSRIDSIILRDSRTGRAYPLSKSYFS